VVPFEKIGPGQSIRLTWQVMGKNGPIPNPAGIRYLPADEGVAFGGTQNLLYASTAMAGLNLIASVTNIVIAAQTLQELRRVSKRVDEVVTGQRRIEAKVEESIVGIKRVEVGVSEARLARVVSNALRAASNDEGLSFEPFHQLSDDLQSFLDDAGIARGLLTNFRLGSDLRNDLQNISALLRGVRLRLATHWNQQHADPALAWRCDLLEDYWSTREIQSACQRMNFATKAVFAMTDMMRITHKSIDARFSFNESADHQFVQTAISEAGLGFLWSTMLDGRKGSFKESLAFMEQSAATALAKAGLPAKSSPWFHDIYYNEFLSAAAFVAVSDANLTSSEGQIPMPVLSLALDADGPGSDVVLRDFRRWWLYNTDDGIVYRAWLECAGAAHGYGVVWPDVQTLSEGITTPLPDPEPVRIELESETDLGSAVPIAKPNRRFR
jgi:hypothetical protein